MMHDDEVRLYFLIISCADRSVTDDHLPTVERCSTHGRGHSSFQGRGCEWHPNRQSWPLHDSALWLPVDVSCILVVQLSIFPWCSRRAIYLTLVNWPVLNSWRLRFHFHFPYTVMASFFQPATTVLELLLRSLPVLEVSCAGRLVENGRQYNSISRLRTRI